MRHKSASFVSAWVALLDLKKNCRSLEQNISRFIQDCKCAFISEAKPTIVVLKGNSKPSKNMSEYAADDRYKCQVHFDCIVQVQFTK